MIEISECEGWKWRQRHPKWPYWKIWSRNLDKNLKFSKINISKFFGRKYQILEKLSFEIVVKSKINVKKSKIKIRIKSSLNFNKPRFFKIWWFSVVLWKQDESEIWEIVLAKASRNFNYK